MNKLLVAVEEQSYAAPTKATVQRVPDQGVAAGHQGDDPALDLQLLRAARRVPHRAAHRLGEAAKLTGAQVNALYAKLAETGKKDGKKGLSPADHPPRPRLPAQGLQGRRALGAPHAQPPRCRRPAAQAKGDGTREMKTWTQEQLGLPRVGHGRAPLTRSGTRSP